MNTSQRLALLLALGTIATTGCNDPVAPPDAFIETTDAFAEDVGTDDAFAARDAPAELDANIDVGVQEDAGDAGDDVGLDAGSDAGIDAGSDAGVDAGNDAGSDAGVDAGNDAGRDAGNDAGSDAGRDAGNDAGSDAGRDAGNDAGRDAGMDAGRDAGMDAGNDAGNDAGRDAGNDAGRDAYVEPEPCSPLPSGLTTRVIEDSASGGTPDTYMFNVNPGDPFCATITGGGSDPWELIVSNGLSSGIYCSGDSACSIFVPAGQNRIFVTATNEGSPAFYRLTLHYIPRL